MRGENTVQLKGLDKMYEKLPAYQGKRIVLLPLRGAVTAFLSCLFVILLSITPRMFHEVVILAMAEPFLPVLGVILIAMLALRSIWSLWDKRECMWALHGELAYQQMIHRGVTGVFLVLSLILLTFISIPSFGFGSPVNELTIQWSQPLLLLFGIAPNLELWLRIVSAGVLLAFGALTIRSSIMTFGLDYMTVVYLYFPEESKVQEHEIYSVVRHPAYLGGILVAAAGVFFRFSVYSIVMFLLVCLVFNLQIRKEENELVERFGAGYLEYREEVPALLVRPSKLRTYLRFLRMN